MPTRDSFLDAVIETIENGARVDDHPWLTIDAHKDAAINAVEDSIAMKELRSLLVSRG